MNVLVFAPHPDDDIIGCGGSIAKHVNHGDHVMIAYMTSGEGGNPRYSKTVLGGIREKEAKDAAKLLGVTDLIFLRNPDGRLRYGRNMVSEIVKIIRDILPEIVYVPHENEADSDHRVTNKLVLEAVRRAGTHKIGETAQSITKILCYEVWTPIQTPSDVEDITAFIDLKMAALSHHKSQIDAMRYDEAAKSLNRYRGVMSQRGTYCECFQTETTSSVL